MFFKCLLIKLHEGVTINPTAPKFAVVSEAFVHLSKSSYKNLMMIAGSDLRANAAEVLL